LSQAFFEFEPKARAARLSLANLMFESNKRCPKYQPFVFFGTKKAEDDEKKRIASLLKNLDPAITAFLKKFKEHIKNDSAIAQEFELVAMIAHYETRLIDAVNAAAQNGKNLR
jgi:hypothetical protein